MIRLIVRYTVAAVLAIVGGYFLLRAYTEATAGIVDVAVAPSRNWSPLVLVLLFWGLAALVAFLPARVVLCELVSRESGERSLLRYLDLQAKRRGIPARTPEVILYTDTEAHHVSEAWAEADARDIDRALEQVNIKRLLMDITSIQAMVMARDIRAAREISVAK